MFSYFVFARFFEKNCKKTVQNPVPKKTSKNHPPGTCFGTQNPLKSTSERPEIAKIAQQIEKIACKNSCVFWYAKKTRKNEKKRVGMVPPGGMRGARGGKEGCKTPAKVCMRSANMRRNFAMEVLRWSLCKSCGIHLTRQQGCGGFKRSAHSAVPILVAWRFGGNEGLEGFERNRDWWSWTGKNTANLKQTLKQSYPELADIFLEFWCIWIKFTEKSVFEGVWGVRSHRKCYQDQALHQKLKIGESQDYPKEAESCPQIGPREAMGKQITPLTVILRGKSIQNLWEIAQNRCQ